MSRTLAEALLDAQTLLHDYAGLRVDPGVLKGWLDQGQKDVTALTFCYQRPATFTSTDTPQAFVAGQRLYALESPVGSGGLGLTRSLGTLHVKLDGVPLPKWTPLMIEIADVLTDEGGTPRYWDEFAGFLMLMPYPSPAFVQHTYTMELTYAAWAPDWVTVTDATILPESFELLPIYYAVVRVLMSKRRWPQAGRLWQFYLAGVQQARGTNLLQLATPYSERVQPTATERTDEPRRLALVRSQRALLRRRR